MASTSSDSIRQILLDYDVSVERGFLPDVDPLLSLSGKFSAFEECVTNIHNYASNNTIRSKILELPVVDFSALKAEPEQRRAHLVLALLVHAYVWGNGKEAPMSRVPSVLAIPFETICNVTGLPPVLVHPSLVLYNWKRKDASQPVTLDNIDIVSGFLGPDSVSEAWFYCATVGIEAVGAPTLKLLVECQELAEQGSLDELSKKLNEVTAIVRATTKVGSRMFEKLDPKVFYNDLRPYLSGWKDNKNLPSLVYEGAFDNKPLSWAGGSAAQSSLIQSWDAALGVQHTSDKTQFILEMRKYMLPKHRQFVEYLAAKSPSIRDVVASARSTHPHLEQAFDLCVKTVVEFRTMHIQLVARYVVSQSTKSDEQGTGGTDIMPFLKTSRAETVAAMIRPPASQPLN